MHKVYSSTAFISVIFRLTNTVKVLFTACDVSRHILHANKLNRIINCVYFHLYVTLKDELEIFLIARALT